MSVSMSTTTPAHRYRSLISLLVPILLSGTRIFISGQENRDGLVIDSNQHHSHNQKKLHHHAAAVLDGHHNHEVEESNVNRHDHSEHIHDENCNHDHDHDTAEAGEDKNTPHTAKIEEPDVDHDHSEHNHDENHDHDHGNKRHHNHHDNAAEGAEDKNTSDTAEQSSSEHSHDHSRGHSHSHNHSHRSKRPKPIYTPLMEAIRDDDMDTFQQLISDSSTDINQYQDGWPNTALLYTFVLRKYAFTLKLLETGVDVRAKNSEGISPLLLALKTVKDDELRLEIINTLVDAGADANDDILEQYLDEYRELMQNGGRRKGDSPNGKDELEGEEDTVKEEL